MKRFCKISIEVASEQEAEIVMAQLEDHPFYAFETGETQLCAYIRKKELDEQWLKNLGRPYKIEIIEETNWNRDWENSFSSVIIKDFVGVRADFHPPVTGVKYEIVITPKMSFGTGHHATTAMMMELMSEIDFKGRCVIDFGAGTGILSILAEKLGATNIRAIDNDENCIASCRENILQNHCKSIHVSQRSMPGSGIAADIILANINLRVLLENIENFSGLLKPGGWLLIAGFLNSDVEVLARKMEKKFELKDQLQREEWSAIRFQRKP